MPPACKGEHGNADQFLSPGTGGGSLHVLLEGISRQKGPEGQLKIFTRLSGDMNVRVALAGCLKAQRKAVRLGISVLLRERRMT